MKYYGVRYAKDCNPDDFWKSYFTSSNYVKEYRKLYGEPNIKQIRKTFDDRDCAVTWEHKVLRRLDVENRDDYLNKYANWKTPANKIFTENHKKKISKALKGKTSEQKKTQALYASKCAREKNLGKKRPDHSKLMKRYYKTGKICPPILKGKDHPNYGGLKEETKIKISKSTKDRPKVCCIKCHKNDDNVSDGVWTCHFSNHHKNC